MKGWQIDEGALKNFVSQKLFANNEAACAQLLDKYSSMVSKLRSAFFDLRKKNVNYYEATLVPPVLNIYLEVRD